MKISAETLSDFFYLTRRKRNEIYETAHQEALNNGSHTTIYLSDNAANREDAWYFFLKGEKEIDILYKDIFQKIETLKR